MEDKRRKILEKLVDKYDTGGSYNYDPYIPEALAELDKLDMNEDELCDLIVDFTDDITIAQGVVRDDLVEKILKAMLDKRGGE